MKDILKIATGVVIGLLVSKAVTMGFAGLAMYMMFG